MVGCNDIPAAMTSPNRGFYRYLTLMKALLNSPAVLYRIDVDERFISFVVVVVFGSFVVHC